MAEPDPPVRAQYFARHFRAAMTDADRRADAQQHLDSRSSRIAAYITSLETSLATAGGSVAALLERRLTQARRDLDASTRSHLAAAVPSTAKPRVARARVKAAEEPAEEGTPDGGLPVVEPTTAPLVAVAVVAAEAVLAAGDESGSQDA